MSVWRLHIHTREDELGRYCLDHDVVAMGWSFEDLLENSEPELAEIKARVYNLKDNWEDFLECAEDRDYKLDESLYRLHDNVKPGDSIWLYFNDKYYIARVTSQSRWQFCQEARKYHAANQLINIRWHEVGNSSSLVPPVIELAFSDEESTFRKILDYDVEGFSIWLLNAFEHIVEPYKIWRINLNPGDFNISEYCLANNVAAMGWSFKTLPNENNSELEKKVEEIKNWKEYLEYFEKYDNEYYSELSSSLRKFHDEVKIGDVIWLHAKDGYYYFGVVKSGWSFNNDLEARRIDASNQREVYQWHKIEDCESVPPELPHNFLGQTFREVSNSVVKEFTLEQLRRLKNENS